MPTTYCDHNGNITDPAYPFVRTERGVMRIGCRLCPQDGSNKTLTPYEIELDDYVCPAHKVSELARWAEIHKRRDEEDALKRWYRTLACGRGYKVSIP